MSYFMLCIALYFIKKGQVHKGGPKGGRGKGQGRPGLLPNPLISTPVLEAAQDVALKSENFKSLLQKGAEIWSDN